MGVLDPSQQDKETLMSTLMTSVIISSKYEFIILDNFQASPFLTPLAQLVAGK